MAYYARLLFKEVASVPSAETVLEAVRLMRRKSVGCVVVADEGKIAGVFTERDIMRAVSEELDLRTTPVSQVMTRDPLSVDCAEPLERVFELLSRGRFRHVIVTEGGRPAGIASLGDFAGVLREVFSDSRYIQYFVDYLSQTQREGRKI